MRKFSPRNLGCGVLWHGKSKQSAKVFSAKIALLTNSRKFSPSKVSRYTVFTPFWTLRPFTNQPDMLSNPTVNSELRCAHRNWAPPHTVLRTSLCRFLICIKRAAFSGEFIGYFSYYEPAKIPQDNHCIPTAWTMTELPARMASLAATLLLLGSIFSSSQAAPLGRSALGKSTYTLDAWFKNSLSIIIVRYV